MPQASQELFEKFGADEGKALKQLKVNFIIKDGWISAKPDHEITDEEADAIEYLIDEWDYAYSPCKEDLES